MLYLFGLKSYKYIYFLFLQGKMCPPFKCFLRAPIYLIDIRCAIRPGLALLLWVYLLMSYMVNTKFHVGIKSEEASLWWQNQTRRTSIFQARRYMCFQPMCLFFVFSNMYLLYFLLRFFIVAQEMSLHISFVSKNHLILIW